jgi:hypothetical protein
LKESRRVALMKYLYYCFIVGHLLSGVEMKIVGC